MIDAALRAQVDAWIAADPDAHDRAELSDLLARGAGADLAERFAGPLRFGTAGLRAPLRAGPNGMNLAVVRRTTAGLADWVRARGGSRVVVGYDARRHSREFAHDAAATLAGAGLVPLLSDRPWPTPITAFAVRHLGADAGIQVTASHNPAADNGYKVYDGFGVQIVGPDDERIAAAIAAAPGASDIVTGVVAPSLGDDLVAEYRAVARRVVAANGPRALRIVYTPLCGVGGAIMVRLFADCGFDDVRVVHEQFAPDPSFPGLPFPNPEEPGVLDAAIALARRIDADVVIANDPDADRLAVCVDSPLAGWRMLSGDELGVLLAGHVMRHDADDSDADTDTDADRADGRGRVVARSVVSSRWLDRLFPTVVTLTGFKWIARAGTSGAPWGFGYEEALGYAVSGAVRDKDGLTAALVAAELAASVRESGGLLAELDRHSRGLASATSQRSARFAGAGAATAMQSAIDRLSTSPPPALGRYEIASVRDYRDRPSGSGRDALPATDLVELLCVAGHRVMVRPSGTEPKLKCYIEAVGSSAVAAGAPDPPSAERYERTRAELLAVCDELATALALHLGLAGARPAP